MERAQEMYYFFHLSCESYLPFTIMQWKFNMAAPMKKCSAIVYSGFFSFHPAENFFLRLKHCRSDMQSHLLKTRLCSGVKGVANCLRL